jgi:hypothetical protein
MRGHRRRELPKPVQWAILIAAAALCILGLKLLTNYIPFSSDWEVYFQPITGGWLDGSLVLYQDTRWGGGYWSPPWLIWLLIPLAVWPVWLGWGALVVATLVTMAWLTKNYANRWLVFASPLIIDLVLDGPVEIVPMLGIALGWLAADRPYLLGIALVLMSTKPQTCFLVALWLLLNNRHRIRALLIPILVFVASLILHGWDWPLRWASGPSVLGLIDSEANTTPWRSIGIWMAPVALLLGIWALRLPRTRLNLGALVVASALVTPVLGSYSMVHVLAFGLLPLGFRWALVAWIVSFTVFLRPFFGQPAVKLDFLVAAVLMIGYLLHANRREPKSAAVEASS